MHNQTKTTYVLHIMIMYEFSILSEISEVTDDQKVSNGGGLEEEGEMIEVIEMSIDELKANLEKKELLKTNGRNLAGLYWFLAKKSNCL